MELILTDEQVMLQDSAERLLQRAAGPDAIRAARESETTIDRALWQEICDAGWLAILVPESAGGLGLGLTELALVLEKAGGALLTAPVCLAAATARTLARCEARPFTDALASDVISGARVVMPALQESPRAVELAEVSTVGALDGDGLKINGAKVFVPYADAADGFLVNVETPNGRILAYVAKETAGMTLANAQNVDGSGSATLALSNVQVPNDHVIAGANLAPELTAGLAELILVGTSAELLGVMDRAFNIALDYLKVRNQFGKPIGSFQALQHRAADDYMETELTRSLLFQVCAMTDDGADIAAMASALKAKASGAALKLTKNAIQYHGAIGYTDEHDIGLYLKRAMSLAALYGNEAHHRRRFGQQTG